MSIRILDNDICPYCHKELPTLVSIKQHMRESIQCHMKAVLATRNSKPNRKKQWQPPPTGQH